MSISKTEAIKLFELGFQRPLYADTVYPQDIFEYQDAVWVVGGRILPSGAFLCEEEVFKKGVWIPSILDLMSWLEDNDCKFNLSYTGIGYKLKVSDSHEIEYSSKGATPEFAFYNVIIKILKKYGGNPVNKEIEVIEAEFIEREDL
ncbi:hypothetical protein M5X00_25240 [Paenibacillus alvei]|uniref:Uncharacterized protein n=1 Tax=Paenibacillus alvei TaxID=44250 RepID=A0ABT4H7K1_PAEAL|nr:hypothetical protein [Paenibacillus alvei]MCY9544909.1 hypothetical protein [Paenibacillus alvei]MCY9706383.1 hypothetical protein [Paenibacillus alvei]MCY9737187.1 hypothetical protein [Paenibacillus alvei]MCY9757537.1 hypothetical protein [Paenibacillus alvei]MCY9764950.1 hypothetical protein [Paenibacillus alvei]